MAAATPAPISHGRRRDALVQALLADIFQGRLRPGQHLVTQELAERFAVSHTPIREALIALSGIGVITLQPNRGAVVRRIGPQEVREVCQVRRALECEAVRLACRRIPVHDLERLKVEFASWKAVPGRLEAAEIIRAQALDSALHDLVASSSGNAFLVQELNRLKTLFRAFRDAAWEHDDRHQDSRRLAEEAEQHLAIVTALLQQDARAAAHAMSIHIRSGMKYWSRSLTPAVPVPEGSIRKTATIPGKPIET